MLRKMLGWGGGDVNVPCTCTHVGCYARCWVGVGGMLTLLALAHMLEKKDAADSLLKFKRALNADATFFFGGLSSNLIRILSSFHLTDQPLARLP